MRRSGDKATARALARELGVPINEGSDVVSQRGGGARGRRADRLPGAAQGRGRRRRPRHAPGRDRRRAGRRLGPGLGRGRRQAFGDGRIFVERYVRHARHVEVQVLGDGEGGVVHVGHRDCTLQRRYQKLIEEAPAYGLPPALDGEITDASRRMIGALDYAGAATCEFLVDPDRGTAGFLEINARLQVEHPVSEMVTGVDIVREQLRIAGGEGLSVTQERDRDHAATRSRCGSTPSRPQRDFAPSPGT